MTDTQQIRIRIPRELIDSLRVQAAIDRIQPNDFIRQAIAHYVAIGKKRKAAK